MVTCRLLTAPFLCARAGWGSSLWLTRAAVLRGVGVALALAFLRLAQEQRVVLASDGVAPASYHPSPSASVFALLGFGDWQLQLVSWGGLFLALMLVGLTVHWFALPLILWLAYLSVLSLEGGLAPPARCARLRGGCAECHHTACPPTHSMGAVFQYFQRCR